MENDLDTNILDHLKRLHTSEIDARNGYEEALDDAEGKGLTPLFRDMIALHHNNIEELAGELSRQGERPDGSGSFLSTVHRTIINLRSLFNGLDDSVLPGLIDGEKRNVEKYDEALAAASASPIAAALAAQRDNIQQKIALMETRKAAVETAS
ncbi:ferritin-like domain-containing protein [Rhodoblastus sphagnicola]|nr:PA2169 family four-helix-bundle protein [Rhodoblastus sphagnicola]